MENHNDTNEKSKIDILNRKLYEKKSRFNQHERGKLHEQRIHITEDFSNEEFEILKKKQSKYKLPSSLFKRIFIGTVIVFLFALIIAFLTLYKGNKQVSNELISMDLLGQPFVDAGEPLTLLVRIQNFNEKPLQIPDIIITYPIDNNSGEQKSTRRSLPDIPKGGRVEEEFKIPLIGQEGEQRKITANLEYHIPGSSSIFTKETSEDVIIRSTPTHIMIDAPEKVINGQDVTFSINLKSNTTETLRNILLRVELPSDFEYISANKNPSFGQELWRIPKLDTENNFTLRIKAKVHSFPGESRAIRVYVGKQNAQIPNEIATTYNQLTHNFEVERPFLDTKILIDGKRQSIIPVKSGTDVSVEINYKNTLDIALNDVKLNLFLNGNLYDRKSIHALNAEYNSLNSYIVWSKGSYERFKELKPGEEGSIQFTFNTKKFISSNIEKNPRLYIWVSETATGENGKEYRINQSDSTELRGISKLSISTFSHYREGPFKNYGPYPPKANKKTNYTLTFQIRNHPNDLKNVTLSAILPSYVKPTQKVFPSTEAKHITYIASTGELKWEIPNIPAETGVKGKPAKELSIQIEATPSLSHIGEILKLAKDIKVEAHDTFSNTDVVYHANDITSHVRDKNTLGGLVKE